MSKLRSTVSALGASLALLVGCGQATAEEFSWSVNIGGTTDYVFRGQSQNNEDPTVQGGLDLGYGLFYLGIWASGIDEGFTASEMEYDIYGGIKPVWGPVTFDFGVIYYGYAGESKALSGGVNVDYWEFKAGASGEFIKGLSTGLAVFYSPDYTFETGQTFVLEGVASYALPKVWIFDPSIGGTLGHIFGESGFDDYTYWNAGLTLAVDKLSLDFRYWDTDDVDTAGIGGLVDERFVFTAKVTLP